MNMPVTVPALNKTAIPADRATQHIARQDYLSEPVLTQALEPVAGRGAASGHAHRQRPGRAQDLQHAAAGGGDGGAASALRLARADA